MATESVPAPKGAPFNRDELLIEVGEQVRQAHEIAAGLLEGRHAKPVARSLMRIALILRHVRGLLEGERRAHPRPPARFPAPRPLTPRSFAVAVVASAYLPFEVRLAAADSLLAQAQDRASLSVQLAEAAEHVKARVDILGESVRDAVAALAQADVLTWRDLPQRHLDRAVAAHLKAVNLLGVRP
jgi:hypothetical protein